jgi:hypothetical protein
VLLGKTVSIQNDPYASFMEQLAEDFEGVIRNTRRKRTSEGGPARTAGEFFAIDEEFFPLGRQNIRSLTV